MSVEVVPDDRPGLDLSSWLCEREDLFGVPSDHGVDITTALAGAVSALAFSSLIVGHQAVPVVGGLGEQPAALALPPGGRLLGWVLHGPLFYHRSIAMGWLDDRSAGGGFNEHMLRSTEIDPATFRGHNRTQWEWLKDLSRAS